MSHYRALLWGVVMGCCYLGLIIWVLYLINLLRPCYFGFIIAYVIAFVTGSHYRVLLLGLTIGSCCYLLRPCYYGLVFDYLLRPCYYGLMFDYLLRPCYYGLMFDIFIETLLLWSYV